MIGPASPAAIVESAQYTIARFEGLGAKVPPNCRIRRATQRVLSHRDVLPPDGSVDRRRLSEAVRCILDFYLIGRALPPIDACGEDLPHLIEKAVRGADDPVKDRSHARNLQFELYLAAWFKAGGVDVAMPIEPDLQIDYFGSAAGVAAKRVTSVSKIVRRTKEGAKQVHAHTVSGFVALNVDAFIDELTPTETSNLRRLPELEKSRSALSNSNLLGLLIFGTAVEWTEHEPPQLGIRLAAEHQILPRGLADRERLQEFFTNLRATQERRLADI